MAILKALEKAALDAMTRQTEKAFIKAGVGTAREVKRAAALKVSGAQKKKRVERAILKLLNGVDIPWVPNFIERPLKVFLVSVLIEAFYKALKEFGVI